MSFYTHRKGEMLPIAITFSQDSKDLEAPIDVLNSNPFTREGCDLYLILLEGNGKAVLIQFVPELIPTR